MRSCFVAPWIFLLFSSGKHVWISKSPWLLFLFILGTGKVLFQIEPERRTSKTWRIMETFGNELIGLISVGKISVVNSAASWRLKSSLAGSTGTIFSFLRLNAGFGHVPVPCWDQMDQLCSLNCAGDWKSGMSSRQVPPDTAYLHRWQIRPGFATPWCLPAPSLRVRAWW